MNISVKKASGELSAFSEEKLLQSLMRSGASTDTARKVIQAVRERLYEGMPTKKVYRIAFNELKKGTRPVAARYKLKRAIMELGPSGFPFEKYIAEILKMQDYTVLINQVLQGRCVKHEVDIIAEKDNAYFMIECKYHNLQGTACDVKIPLYVQARFNDIESAWKTQPIHDTKLHQGWVVTNTRFTADAIQYGTCAGLYLLGWNYPIKGSLKELVDKLRLYPITCLTTLTKHEKQQLLEKQIVLCRDLYSSQSVLQSIGLRGERINNALAESKDLCV